MTELNQFQAKFGKPSKGAATKVVPYLSEWVQTFIRHAPFAILASSDADGQCGTDHHDTAGLADLGRG